MSPKLIGVCLAALYVVGPSLAHAADLSLCVAPSGESPEPGECLDGTFPTIAEALATAEALPTGGPSDTTFITLLGGPESPPHLESIVVDTRGNAMEPQFRLLLSHRPLCPTPDSPPGDPVIEIATNGNSSVDGLNLDLSPEGPCPGTRSGVLGWGGGQVGVINSEIVGWTGFAVADGLAGEPLELTLYSCSIRGGLGSAVRAHNSLVMGGNEIVGNRLPNNSLSPALVWIDTTAREVKIWDLVLFGNLVQGTGALMQTQADWLRNVAFIANGTEGGPLLRAGFGEWRHEAGADPGEVDLIGLSDCIFARNSRVGGIESDFELPAWEEGGIVSPLVSGGLRCLGEGNPAPYHERPNPFDGYGGGEGPLIELDPAVGYPDEGGLMIARSFFVENQVGAGPLVEARLAPGLSVQFIHNTVGGNDALSQVISADGGGAGSEVVAVRNLFIGSGDSTSPGLVTTTAGVDRVFVSMNGSVDGPPWSPGSEEGREAELVGPQVPLTGAFFRDGSAVRISSACDQLLERCGGLTPEACDTWAGEHGTVPCAIDAAANWIPTPGSAGSMSWEWPWDTEFLPREVAGADRLGATGWLFDEQRGTLDGVEPIGDADGYPDLFDCDNTDPDVIPRVPEFNGVDSATCVPDGGNCWVCPEGTEADDDDDDDDDSATDDDDSSEGSPEEPGADPEPEETSPLRGDGCEWGPGCGFSWSAKGAWVLLLPICGAPSRRRRPRTR